MGIVTSSHRNDDLLFPPEVLEVVMKHLSVRDKLIGRQVCRLWNLHIMSASGFENETLVMIEGCDEPLEYLGNSIYFEPLYTKYSLKSVDLTRKSLSFWSNYSNFITHLYFYDCSIIPHNNSPEDEEFMMGCPNLKHLTLKSCDKYLMLGPQYFHLHAILCLENLESLNVACNNYLTDSILFSMLLKTNNSLKSLDLSSCPLVFMNAVYRRFYPESNQQTIKYSDHILSFQKLFTDFLSLEIGSKMEELIVSSTRIESRAIDLMNNTEKFKWKSMGFSRCYELKTTDLINFISKHTITKLNLEKSKVNNQDLQQIGLENLESLILKECCEITTTEFLQRCHKLKYLDLSHSTRAELSPEYMNCLQNLEVLNLKSMIPFYHVMTSSPANTAFESCLISCLHKLVNLREIDVSMCGAAITDEVAQAILKNLVHLRILTMSKCKITDIGIAGREVDDFDDRLPPRLIETKRAAILQRMVDLKPGYCLSRLKNLKSIDLSYCQDLSEATWKIALRLPNLISLNLMGCQQISKSGVISIISHCKNLEIFNLAGCGLHMSGDEELIAKVRRDLPRLRQFIL